MPVMCYTLAIKHHMKLTGIWYAFLMEEVLSTVICLSILIASSWKNVKGIHQEKENTPQIENSNTDL
jgi:Na+-driven multidrug efflux pump